MLSFLYGPALTSVHAYWKNKTFVSKVMSLLFNTLSRCHCFSSKEQTSFNFMAAVTVNSGFGAQENKICHCVHFFPIYLPWSVGTRCQDLRFFLMLSFKPAFSLSFSPLSRGSLVPLHFLLLEWYICMSEVVDISPSNLDSSFWFIYPSILHDVLCIEVKISRVTIY